MELTEAELSDLRRRIQRHRDYRRVYARMRRATKGRVTLDEVSGYEVSGEESDSRFRVVAFEYNSHKERTITRIVWVESEEAERVFAHLAGDGEHLDDVAKMAESAPHVSTGTNSSADLKVERFITPTSDDAFATIGKGDSGEAGSNSDEMEVIKADMEAGVVSSESSGFVDCMTDSVDGILTGAGACAVTCRDGCLKRPNWLGCSVCAGCSTAAACYIGHCAKEHGVANICTSALSECAGNPTPYGTYNCITAYGCLGGSCGII